MLTLSTVELTAVTVDLGPRRLDVCVPGHTPVVELLPELLRQGPAGNRDEAAAIAGWELRRLDGRRLAADRGLAEQDVPDGTVLHLVPSTVDWPDWECDDIVETVAAAGGGRAWVPAYSRAAALLAAGLCLAGGLALCALAAPTGPAAPLAIAVVLCLAGTVAARGRRDAAAGRVLAGCGAPYAFAGGALLAPSGTAARLLLGSSALLLYAALAFAGVASLGGVCAGLAVAAVAGALGAGLALVTGTAEAAAVLLCATVLGTPAMPVLAVRLGRLPVPVPGAPAPDREAVRRAVALGSGVLAGLQAGAGAVAVAAGAVLASAGGPGAAGYLAVCATALLLRARVMIAVRHRLPPAVAGLVGYGLAGWALLPAGGRVAGAAVTALVLAAIVLAGYGQRVGDRRPASPYLGRLLELVDAGATVALVPLACASLGLYGQVAALVT